LLRCVAQCKSCDTSMKPEGASEMNRRYVFPRLRASRTLEIVGRGAGTVLLCLAAVLTIKTTAQGQGGIAIDVPNHFTADGRCSFSLTAISQSGADLQENLRLDMPGFSDVQTSQAGGRLTVTARVKQAGFYPFKVTLQQNGHSYSGGDYFVSEMKGASATFDHTGYYVFLGRGDFWDETHPLALWNLQDWKSFADWMSSNRADTLYVLLNGYTLAYPSDKYVMLRDRFSTNARYGFLSSLIDYAHSRGIRVYLTLTTDDHAQGFGDIYPETTRINRFGYATTHRALALEDPKVRKYIEDTLDEVMQLYGNADGFVFHPSEEDPDRFNEQTQVAYHRDTGRELSAATKAERYRWYNRQFAELLKSLYGRASAHNPRFEFVMFNTWWQDDFVATYREILPPSFKICVWYYDELEEKTFRKWPIWSWVESFGADRVIYMPTGEAFLYPQEHSQQFERHLRVDRLVSAATALGVKSCVFFAGWNLGSDDDRRRDLSIARYSTASFVGDPVKMQQLLPDMYTDYFGMRTRVFK